MGKLSEVEAAVEAIENQKLERENEVAVPTHRLFIANLSRAFDDEMLREEFEGFGVVTEAKVVLDGEGESRGFGFVTFEEEQVSHPFLKPSFDRSLWPVCLHNTLTAHTPGMSRTWRKPARR